MDSLTTWEYNGQSFFLDLQDVETAERYEAAFEKMDESEKTFPRTGKTSAIYRAYCAMLDDLFDALFGAGTRQKLFGDTMNAGSRTDAYESFLAFASKQAASSAERRAGIVAKYSPNRAQRRANG